MAESEEYNKYNTYSHIALTQIDTTIGKMEQIHHIEILKKIAQYAGTDVINSSDDECYVNLTYLNDKTIGGIKEYIEHALIQDSFINETERKKQEFKKTLFAGNDDDK